MHTVKKVCSVGLIVHNGLLNWKNGHIVALCA